MTVEQLVQLYAPLAGLLCLAAWVGSLSQKVASQKEAISALQKANDARVDVKPEIARLEATMVALGERMTELKQDTHESFAELNHIIRNRVMTGPAARKPG